MKKPANKPIFTKFSEGPAYEMQSEPLGSIFDPKKKEVLNCWHKFEKFIRSLWIISLLHKTKDDPERNFRIVLRKFLVFLSFIAVMSIVIYGMNSPNVFYQTQALKQLIRQTPFDNMGTTFDTSTTINDFWRFIGGVFLDSLYWEMWYNGKSTSSVDNEIYYQNKLFGVPRIRQIKVRNNTCVIPINFQGEMKECFAPYSSSIEDQSTLKDINGTGGTYYTEAQLNSLPYDGNLAMYSGAGYYIDLTTDRNESKRIIQYHFDNLWINLQTRVLIIDFTVYNANINLFCVVKLLFEFPAVGGVMTMSEFRSVKLIRYVHPSDFVIMAFEIIFVFYVIYYIVEEILEIKESKVYYLYDFWNYVEVAIIISSLICIAFNFYRIFKVSSVVSALLSNPNIYPNFDFVSYWDLQISILQAITLFLAWIKIFNYISFYKTFGQMSITLETAASDLISFGFIFSVMLFAFTQLAFSIFGSQLQEFSTLVKSLYALLRLMLADFNFYQMENVHRILGPIFFILYVFFVLFILINMFLAIITDTYIDVKSDEELQQHDFDVMNYFKKVLNDSLIRMNLKEEQKIDTEDGFVNDGVSLTHYCDTSGSYIKEASGSLKTTSTDGKSKPARPQKVNLITIDTKDPDQPKTNVIEEKNKDNSLSMNDVRKLHNRLEKMEDVMSTVSDSLEFILNKLDIKYEKTKESCSKLSQMITSVPENKDNSQLLSGFIQTQMDEEF